jgi:LysR family glycine cleavage system transcriptional activator
MIDRTLSLNALRAFEAAARHGSLTAAARELRVSVSSISRHVTLLEEHFDRKLLRRLPSGVKLTEQGKSYFSQISQAFELIERAGIQTTREIREQKLYVSLYTTFALEWMAPRLERFQTAFPDIELKLRISLDEADFDSDRVDIALTGAAAFDRRFHYDQVFESHLLPVCAPKFLTGKTPLEAPER